MIGVQPTTILDQFKPNVLDEIFGAATAEKCLPAGAYCSHPAALAVMVLTHRAARLAAKTGRSARDLAGSLVHMAAMDHRYPHRNVSWPIS